MNSPGIFLYLSYNFFLTMYLPSSTITCTPFLAKDYTDRECGLQLRKLWPNFTSLL